MFRVVVCCRFLDGEGTCEVEVGEFANEKAAQRKAWHLAGTIHVVEGAGSLAVKVIPPEGSSYRAFTITA